MSRKAEVGMKCIVIGLGDGFNFTKHGFQLNEKVTITSVFNDGSVMAENEAGVVQILEPDQLGVLIEKKPSRVARKVKEAFWLTVAVIAMLAIMSIESLLDLAMQAMK